MPTLDRATELIQRMAPSAMWEQFGPMVEMSLAMLPADSLSKLVEDLESVYDADGNIDGEKLIEVGRGFGLTDEMIAGYQQSYAAAKP